MDTVSGEQLHQMCQVNGSNSTVARFFKGLGIHYRSDTVYMFVVPPMNAPRAEGMINVFTDLLRKARVKTDIITLAVYNKRRPAESYLKKRAFPGDYSLVTDKQFLNSFVFSAGGLQVPFVTKFCIRSGELLSSYSLLAQVDSAAVAWFVADHSKPKSARPQSERTHVVRMKTDHYAPIVARRLRLLDSGEHPLSTCYWTSINPSGTYFSLVDDLTNDVYVFDLATGMLLNVLSPDSSEERRFISGPEQLYEWLKQNNIISSMYLSHAFCDDTTVIIAASLPRLTQEIRDKDTNYGYYNSPALVRKNVRSGKLVGYASFQSLPSTSEGGFVHKGACFVCERNLAFVPFWKGWPCGNQMLSESTPPGQNPFREEFYRQNVYQFAVFGLDGTFVRFWGNLGSRFAELKLGYYAAGGGLAKYRDGKYYLSDQFSGKVYIYDQNAALLDSVKVFDDPPLVFPAIDRTKEPERYLLETFKQNFRARIVDFLITDEYCYALVLWDETQPIVYKVGLEDHTNKKYALPSRFEGKTATYYLLRQTPSGVTAVSLLESSNETWYCEFKLP